MTWWRRIFLLLAVAGSGLVWVACASGGAPIQCPEGSTPLAGNISFDANGNAKISLKTNLAKLENLSIPAEVSAAWQTSKGLKAKCVASSVLEAIAARPDIYIISIDKDGNIAWKQREEAPRP